MSSELLNVKKEMKKKAPKFVRTDAHKKAKLEGKWRKPKGLQNKMRLQKKGYRRIVKSGYGTPASLKGVSADGKKRVLVSNIKELEALNPKEHVAVISSTLGAKKKIALLEKCKSKGVDVFRVKDAEKKISELKSRFEERKNRNREAREEKTKKKKTLEETLKGKKTKKKQEEKKKVGAEEEKKTEKTEKESREDIEKKQKEEKDKIITKKL